MTFRTFGYNWRNTLSDFASIAGILAGFCVAFIGIILGWSVADTPIYNTAIKWGNIAAFLVGISAALFIAASQLFLRAKDSDMWNLSEKYEQYLKKEVFGAEWEKVREENLNNCRRCEMWGRRFYNPAIILMFLGLGFLIAPYNYTIAFIVAGSGISLEFWQWKGLSKPNDYKTKKEEGKKVAETIWESTAIALVAVMFPVIVGTGIRSAVLAQDWCYLFFFGLIGAILLVIIPLSAFSLIAWRSKTRRLEKRESFAINAHIIVVSTLIVAVIGEDIRLSLANDDFEYFFLLMMFVVTALLLSFGFYHFVTSKVEEYVSRKRGRSKK